MSAEKRLVIKQSFLLYISHRRGLTTENEFYIMKLNDYVLTETSLVLDRSTPSQCTVSSVHVQLT